MAKVIAITNTAGALLGVLRTDPVDIGNGLTIRPVPVEAAAQRHQILDVPDGLLGKPVHEVHAEVRRRLTPAKA
jgi:hypothetical protein